MGTNGLFGLAFGFLTMVLTGLIFILDWHRRKGGRITGGLCLNGAGFGLLPAAAVWNAFLFYDPWGEGAAVIPPLPEIPWLTEQGRYFAPRIDLCLAVIAFVILCVWLIARKQDLAPRGDLLMVAGTVWSGIRAVTEAFHGHALFFPGGHPVLRYAAFLVMLICLAVWTARRDRKQKSRAQSWMDWAGVLLCTAAAVVTSEGLLTVGSAIGDLAVIAGASILTMVITLIVGADSRKPVR